MTHHAVARSRGDLLEPLERVLALCRARLTDRECGGWFQRIDADGSARDSGKGTLWTVAYHVAGMCAEAMRLA